ncbi:hypothetical protein PS467_10170 [Streptomyces luomodiensis]|uniref:Translation initiation factor IF-2 n=1 Tax=Streptomyces luomodiensis TaxID=3026192 RepID=A0ABY9USY4_9ACTN|nr:hypothetical protein [Streptomyces sp. SCA4-21]WNE95675.1 hypothetical protein PS467_10170 [Streptomyces sp. SCA4-21]
MADSSVERSGPTPTVGRRVVNPTLVTPGPQPVEAGPPADEAPQVLRGEVIGPRHARHRPVDNRRKAAAGAILLSATGAATALLMFLGKDAREASAAPEHNTATAAPDEPDSQAVPYAEAAVGDTPLRGARAEKSEQPESRRPDTAQPTAQAPAGDSTPAAGPRTPSSGGNRSAPSWPDRASQGSGRYDDWQDAAEAFDRWVEQQARQYADDGGSGPYGTGQGDGRGGQGHGGGYGGGRGNGYGGGHGGGNGHGGGYGGGHRR